MNLMKRRLRALIFVGPGVAILIVDIVEREHLGLLGPGAVAFIKITDGQCVSLIFRMLHSMLD